MSIHNDLSDPVESLVPPSSASGEDASFVALSVREALQGLKNGQVTISIHNGEIIQIDRILRKRQFKLRPHS